jgi:hypothetical protein
MNSMVVRKYKSADVTHLRRGYRKPFAITTPILDIKDGHYVRPNKVVVKYLDFKKDDDSDVHGKIFNFVVKTNAKKIEEYIINAFTYTLRDTTLD